MEKVLETLLQTCPFDEWEITVTGQFRWLRLGLPAALQAEAA